MFRERLVKDMDGNQLFFLESNWSMPIEGLVKVPIFDTNDPQYAYTVYYSEVEQTYKIIKFSMTDGSKIWSSMVVNGGYGTPVVWDSIIVVLKGFNGVAAFNKINGMLEWELNFDARIRSSLNIINANLVFTSGGSIIWLDKLGNITNTVDRFGTFFFGTVSKQMDHFIAVGTRHDSKDNCSKLILYGLSHNGDSLFEVDLGKSSVISSEHQVFRCLIVRYILTPQIAFFVLMLIMERLFGKKN